MHKKIKLFEPKGIDNNKYKEFHRAEDNTDNDKYQIPNPHRRLFGNISDPPAVLFFEAYQRKSTQLIGNMGQIDHKAQKRTQTFANKDLVPLDPFKSIDS